MFPTRAPRCFHEKQSFLLQVFATKTFAVVNDVVSYVAPSCKQAKHGLDENRRFHNTGKLLETFEN
jgi:hypothetical protein